VIESSHDPLGFPFSSLSTPLERKGTSLLIEKAVSPLRPVVQAILIPPGIPPGPIIFTPEEHSWSLFHFFFKDFFSPLGAFFAYISVG